MTSFHRQLRIASARGALLLACAAPFAASCSDDTKPRGQVMLAIDSDLSIPKNMNQIGVQVFDTDDNVINSQDLDILPIDDGYALPGTLALVPPNSGGQTVRVVVTAKQTSGDQSLARVVRTAIVTVPTDRIALMRMPLHWLCSEKTDCEKLESCIAGVCQDATTDSNDLPDYTPALVFGGGDAHGVGSYCLDAQQCFANTRVLKPNRSDCTVPLPVNADPATLNVALVLPPGTDGHCFDGDDGACYIPLDSDPAEGFAIVGDRIQMPPAACARASVVGVSVSSRCRTKDLSVPICGPWLGWDTQPGEGDGGPNASAGAGGAAPVSGGGGAGKSSPSSDGGTPGEGGEAGANNEPGAMCPITAELAQAYYYVLVDTSADMASALPTVRQALLQFGQAPASRGLNFGLQVAQAACQGNYSTPLLDFSPLPEAVSKLPQPFSAGAQKRVQLDDALTQTVDTLIALPGPVSRTLVVFTAGVDQGCNTLPDLMHQALTQGLNNGVSVRTVLVTGTSADQPNLSSGLVTQGTPQPVSVAATDLTNLLASLNTFRDAIAPCTYLAPSASQYSVQVASASDGPATFLTRVSSSAQCTANGYYNTGATFTLCPTACSNKGTREVVTDACELTAPPTTGTGRGGTSAGFGGAATGAAGASTTSCPGTLPQNGSACSTVVSGCTFGATSCRCNGKVWQCTGN